MRVSRTHLQALLATLTPTERNFLLRLVACTSQADQLRALIRALLKRRATTLEAFHPRQLARLQNLLHRILLTTLWLKRFRQDSFFQEILWLIRTHVFHSREVVHLTGQARPRGRWVTSMRPLIALVNEVLYSAHLAPRKDTPERLQKLLEQVQEEVHLHRLFSEANLIFQQYGSDLPDRQQKKLASILAHITQLYRKRTPRSFWKTYIYHWVAGRFAVVRREFASAKNHFQALHHLLVEEYPSIPRTYPALWLQVLQRLAGIYYIVGDHNQAIKTLREWRQALRQNRRIYTHVMIDDVHQTVIEIALAVDSHHFSTADKIIRLLLKRYPFLENARDWIGYKKLLQNRRFLEVVLLFYFNAAVAMFCIGKYDQALHWFEQIFYGIQKGLWADIRKDVQAVAPLLYALTLFALQRKSILKQKLPRLQEMCTQIRPLYVVETLLFEFLNQYASNQILPTRLHDHLQNMRKRITRLLKGNPREKLYLKYVDLPLWLQALERGVAPAEISVPNTRTS